MNAAYFYKIPMLVIQTNYYYLLRQRFYFLNGFVIYFIHYFPPLSSIKKKWHFHKLPLWYRWCTSVRRVSKWKWNCVSNSAWWTDVVCKGKMTGEWSNVLHKNLAPVNIFCSLIFMKFNFTRCFYAIWETLWKCSKRAKRRLSHRISIRSVSLCTENKETW